MIRRVERATARFAKPLRAQTYNIARGKAKRGGGCKIYLQALIINQHHAAVEPTFSIRNFGEQPVGWESPVCTRLKYCICLLYIIRVVKRADFNEMF